MRAANLSRSQTSAKIGINVPPGRMFPSWARLEAWVRYLTCVRQLPGCSMVTGNVIGADPCFTKIYRNYTQIIEASGVGSQREKVMGAMGQGSQASDDEARRHNA